jgi:tRNA threonylcarbamoyladenosine modification (KEOPS) complex Cgi121 subunit
MRKISLLSALLLFVTITFAQTNFTATYNFAGNETDVVSFAYNGDTYEGITPQPLLKLGVTSTGSTNNFRAKEWPLGATSESDVFTGVIDLEKYIGFSIEPVAGYTFTITSIKFGLGRSATGPRQFEWRGNADGFASALSTYEALNTNLTNVDGVLTCPDANSNWLNNTLTPGAVYQNLSTTAEFRLYAYNSEQNGGTAGLQGNLIIEGTFVATGDIGLTISSPANNTTVYENQVEVTFSTANFALGTDGQLEYKLNGGTAAYTTTSPFTITGLSEGENTIVFQLVNMDNTALDPAITETRTINYVDPSAPIGNGLETFDNANLTASYSDGSFIGNHAIQWTYTHSRDEGDYSINGKGLMLRNAQESSIESQVLNGGIGSFEVKFRKAFTGANERGLELYINDELKGTSEMIPSLSGENTTIYTFSVNNINISGNVVIKLKIAGTDAQGRQITIDDIAWTSYEGTEPTLTITSPADNITVNEDQVEVNFTTTNFELGTDGKLEYKLNGGAPAYTTTSPFTITGLAEGENTIVFQLVNMDNTALDPAVTVTRTVTYEAPNTDPSLTITSPADNITVNVNQVEVNFTTTNFELGTDGKLEYKLNGGDPVYKTESPFTITGLQEGENTIVFQLVNMDNTALDPVVSVTRTVTYEIVVLEPSLTISSPQNGAIIYSNDITVNFTVQDFVLGADGKLAYKLDEGAIQYYTGTSPLTLTGVAYGTHQIYFELVTMADASLDPAVTTTVNFTNQEPLPGGMETFDNAEIGTSYANGSFIGNNGIEWIYKHSRDEGDYAINGKGLMLRNAFESSIESEVLSGGISSLEVKYRKAFTGANERGIELYINNELKGTSEVIPGVSGENTTIYTLSESALNVPGDFVIKIKIAGNDTQNRQITIDDISWTGYAGTEPYLAITSPSNGQIFYENTVSVNYTTTNFTVGTDGKAKYIIDGAAPVYTTNNPITLTNLADGEHTFSLELVNMDNESYSPAVIRTITFTTNTEGPEFTDIYDIQYTLDESGDSPLKNQYVWVKGIVVANFNPSTYGEGYYIQQGGGAWNGIYVADLVNSPTVGDSVIIAGKVVESYGLTSIKELTYFEAFATDGILAAPAEVSTADAGTEAYESCLVKVIDAECTQGIISYGEWYVDDGSGELLVKENGVSSIQPVVGNHYDIVGVIYYGYSKFSLQYRSDADIVITNINEDFANSLSLYPNPANSFVNISSEFEINNIKVTNNLGQVVLEQNAKSNNVNLNVENLESGIYFININSNDKNTVLRFIKE